MTTTAIASLHTRRALTAPALVAPPLFLLTAAGLSAANLRALRGWGWTPLDHAGVPWPSSLALLPGGWLQTLAFAGTGGALVALGRALPPTTRARALVVCGAGLLACAFPLNPPVGDPGSVGSWLQTWPAVVHAAGFAAAGLAGVLAVAASRRRAEAMFAVLLAAAAALGGALGWYAFLAGFLGWVVRLAWRTRRA